MYIKYKVSNVLWYIFKFQMSKTKRSTSFQFVYQSFLSMNHLGKEKLFRLDKSLIVNDIALVGGCRKWKVSYKDGKSF